MAKVEMAFDQSVKTETLTTGISGLTARRYGNVVYLRFSNVSVSSGTIGTLPSGFPVTDVSTFMRATLSNNKYETALVSITGRTLSASYFIPDTTSSVGGLTGTVGGTLSYIVS